MVMAVLLAVSCGQNGRQGAHPELHTRQFPSVTPPAMIQNQQEIMEYMSQHFWDAFMTPVHGYRCDSLYVAGVSKGDIEQNLANYIYLLDMLPMKEAKKAVAAMADKAEAYEAADSTSNVFESFVELTEKYMFDPNSPLRNEDYYQAYASRLARSRWLDQASMDKYAYIAGTCSLNAVGTKAADFVFSDRNGRERSLYSIESDYTLLFFSNPGCESCLQIINSLREDPKVNAMIAQGALSVVNVYIDEDIQAWRDYMPIYPDNGFDPNLIIRSDRIYNVRAIPSLYLLDSQKTVLMKDAVPEKLFNLINSL